MSSSSVPRNAPSEFIASTLAGRLLPSLRSRLEIRSDLLAALCGDAGPLRDINRALWRNWTVNDGANVALPQPSYEGKLTAKDVQNLHPDVFFADKSNALAIDRMLQLAQRHKIPVFWLLPPLAPESSLHESGAAPSGPMKGSSEATSGISQDVDHPRRPTRGLSELCLHRRDSLDARARSASAELWVA